MFSRKSKEPETVDVLGRPLQCPVCKNTQFFRSKAQLNTAMASFFDFDWANRSATCLTCASCRHISWFNL